LLAGCLPSPSQLEGAAPAAPVEPTPEQTSPVEKLQGLWQDLLATLVALRDRAILLLQEAVDRGKALASQAMHSLRGLIDQARELLLRVIDEHEGTLSKSFAGLEGALRQLATAESVNARVRQAGAGVTAEAGQEAMTTVATVESSPPAVPAKKLEAPAEPSFYDKYGYLIIAGR
jgi:hypothetical protein